MNYLAMAEIGPYLRHSKNELCVRRQKRDQLRGQPH